VLTKGAPNDETFAALDALAEAIAVANAALAPGAAPAPVA
jgi:hypothetical protein